MADPNVDLVYIATPHNLHAEQAILCMKAGKGVLVEKAFGANAAQTREMLAVAKETGMLCAEAIWTRYMPSRAIIDKILASGAIGEIQAIDANLCYPTTAKARITDPALAGGALLDVGVYPINFIDMIMHNAPIARIESSMRAYETGVDAHNSMTFYYENGVMATAQSSILCHSDRTGSVWGPMVIWCARTLIMLRQLTCMTAIIRLLHITMFPPSSPATIRGGGRRTGRNRRSHRMRGNAPRRHPAHHGTHGLPAPRLEPHLPLRTLSSNISFSVGELRFRSHSRR